MKSFKYENSKLDVYVKSGILSGGSIVLAIDGIKVATRSYGNEIGATSSIRFEFDGKTIDVFVEKRLIGGSKIKVRVGGEYLMTY
ncbi:MAG: hypothetical protein FWF56_04605 [Firmicutes bacterium]|nr:hypothetical protein [Bacillota bacterium]MCL1953488.1 hypothetical protein [Bacillota bacterium]